VAHGFSTLPLARVLIDTNVLLGTVFIEDGIARRAVRSVQSLGHIVYCDEISYGEAIHRLDQARRRLALTYDPIALFERLVCQLGILFVPPADPIIPTGIHRHDRHIPRAAGEFATWVMTDDVELQLALTAAGFEAKNSFEVLEAARQRGAPPATEPSLPARTPAAPPGPVKGWVMAWVTPGPWAGGPPSGHRTVVDIPGFGRVSYNTNTTAWEAEFRFAAQIFVCTIAIATRRSCGRWHRLRWFTRAWKALRRSRRPRQSASLCPCGHSGPCAVLHDC
jgi:hypothetical protein